MTAGEPQRRWQALAIWRMCLGVELAGLVPAIVPMLDPARGMDAEPPHPFLRSLIVSEAWFGCGSFFYFARLNSARLAAMMRPHAAAL